MKASVVTDGWNCMAVTAYEKGDEPPHAVDLHPNLINRHQIAILNLRAAENDIRTYLNETGQESQRWENKARAFYDELADMDMVDLQDLDMLDLVEQLGRALGIEE